ncbi:MAG: hypothetical protein GC164_07855 [Phycisphaera sp.]|nr:hypothetical protein [Phycisphaera sp.]
MDQSNPLFTSPTFIALVRWGALVVGVLVVLGLLWFLYRQTRSKPRQRLQRVRTLHCVRCNHDLRNHKGANCPKCGLRIPPEQARLLDESQSNPRKKGEEIDD